MPNNLTSFIDSIPSGVSICGASKRQPLEKITESFTKGLKIIGVNYLQEGLTQIQHLNKIAENDESKASLVAQVEWHFIGHIQSNKIKDITKNFSLIQSVASEKQMKLINHWATQWNISKNILIEINSAEEPNKAGVLPQNALALIKSASQFQNIKIMGLMTMGPWTSEPNKMRRYFKLTADLFNEATHSNTTNYQNTILSMGTSKDYQVAIQCGATLIRIGEIIFGARSKLAHAQN